MKTSFTFKTLLKQKGYSDKAIKEICQWYDLSEKKAPISHNTQAVRRRFRIKKRLTPHRCGEPIKAISSKTIGFPIAAGILTIIAACMSILLGIMCIASFISYPEYPSYRPDYWVLSVGIFGFFACAFGFLGGAMSLRRKNFFLAKVGVCLTTLLGFVAIPAFGTMFLTRLLLGIPIIVFSIPSLIIIIASKIEFS